MWLKHWKAPTISNTMLNSKYLYLEENKKVNYLFSGLSTYYVFYTRIFPWSHPRAIAGQNFLGRDAPNTKTKPKGAWGAWKKLS